VSDNQTLEMPLTSPIRTEDLTKVYRLPRGRVKKALNSLNIDVPDAAIFGFLGPNGAGKTTTIKLLLDFLRPTSGRAILFGKPTDDYKVRNLIGYLPEQPYFHPFLKPLELLSAHAALAGMDPTQAESAAMAALEKVGMVEYAQIPIRKLSKGLTQLIGIAQALVGHPRLLILDEPTSGLDPIGRRRIRDLLVQLRNEGCTIFLSSHLLSEVENLCDVVAVIKNGSVVTCGTPDQIRSANTYLKVYTGPITSEDRNRLQFLSLHIDQQAGHTIFKTELKNAYELFRAMEQLNLQIARVETERESLEEAFLRLAA
jgi:ABC-2 type transport system ATP-binding protein